jgi:hypothetical protein
MCFVTILHYQKVQIVKLFAQYPYLGYFGKKMENLPPPLGTHFE